MRERACLIREVTLVRIETLEQTFLLRRSGRANWSIVVEKAWLSAAPLSIERPYRTAEGRACCAVTESRKVHLDFHRAKEYAGQSEMS
jgi:hypothetical protein